MKLTKKALLAATPVFLNNFEDANQVFKEYETGGVKRYYWSDEYDQKEEPARLKALNKKYKILFADYTYEDYSGDSYVLGYDNEEKKFFEVHGGHCSCYGLEGQWHPEYCETKELAEMMQRRFGSAAEERGRGWDYRRADSSSELEMWVKMMGGK